MRKIFIATLVLAILLVSGGAVFAAAQFQFQPIIQSSPLSPPAGNACDLTKYLNTIFQVAVAVAVVLAVIRIIIKGFQYMTTEAVSGKKGALDGIRSALFGLVLLLASYMILWIINPEIVSLKVPGLCSGKSTESMKALTVSHLPYL